MPQVQWDGVSVPVHAKTKRKQKISPCLYFWIGTQELIFFKKSYLLPEVTNYECNFCFDHLMTMNFWLKIVLKKARQKFSLGNMLLSSAHFRQAAQKCTPLWHLPIVKPSVSQSVGRQTFFEIPIMLKL